MGVYLYGTKGFSHRAPSGYSGETLDNMPQVMGVGESSTQIGLATQSLIFEEHFESLPNHDCLDGCSDLLMVAGYNIPEVRIGRFSDVEQAIYDVSDAWREAIDALMVRPCVPLYLELAVEDAYTFTREDWPSIVAGLGYEVDVSDREGLIAMRDELYKKHGTSLHQLAANALLHAIEHDLDVMTLTDPRQGMSTNLMECMKYSVNTDTHDQSLDREDRLRLVYFNLIDESESWFGNANALLEEVYDDTLATTMAMNLMWYQTYDELLAWAAIHLDAHAPSIVDSIGLRRIVGDAHLQLGQVEQAQQIARQLAEVGDTVLTTALEASREEE